MMAVQMIARMLVLLGLYYGLQAWVPAEFWRNLAAFMFEPWGDYYDLHLRDAGPGFGDPFVIIILIGLGLLYLRKSAGLISLAACAVLSLFIVKVLLAWLDPGAYPAMDPDWWFFAMIACGWLIFAAALREELFWWWVLDKHEGRI